MFTFRVTLGTTLGVLALVFSAAAHAAEPRTWTDSTGRHKTTATFVRVESENVHLKLASGRVIAVPLARLSEADREHVARLSKPDASKPPEVDSLKAIQDASVVVWAKQGERALPSPGIVVYQRDGRADVLAKRLSLSLALRNKAQPTYEIAVGEKRVPADWKAERYGNVATLFSAPAAEMPKPLTLGEAATTEEGQTVHVVGYETTTGIPPSATRYEQTGTIHRVFRTLQGEIASVRIELSSVPPDMSLVANKAGQLVGILVGPHVAPRRSSRTPGPQPRFFIMYPPGEFFARLGEPTHVHTSVALKRAEAEKCMFQFIIFASDPFGQIRNPQLHVSPFLKSDKPPAAIDFQSLGPRKQTLALKNQAPDEQLADAIYKYDLVGRQATFVGDLETQFDVSLLQSFRVQFVYETPDGQTQHGGIQSIVPRTVRRR